MNITNNTISGNVNSGSGNMYVAGRDLNINSPHDNGTDMVDLLKELRILIEKENSIEEEEKESIVDDIEVIREQVDAEKPNKTRIKKAWERLTKFATKIPAAVEGAGKIREILEKIYTGLQNTVEGLDKFHFMK